MKAEQQQFHGYLPSETKKYLSDWNTVGAYGHPRMLARHRLDISVTNKLICSNVVLFDTGTQKHLAHGRHHSGRPGNVVDGALQVG
jgi:hypothetical protein